MVICEGCGYEMQYLDDCDEFYCHNCQEYYLPKN